MIKRVIKVVVFLWIAFSIAASCFASLNEDFCAAGGGIEDRCGLLVAQVCRIYEGNVDRWGYTISGNVGDTAIFIFNPFTNINDDIIMRIDIHLTVL